MFEESDRGRLVVAAVLTVVALPFLWSSKQNESGPESVAAIGAGETAIAVTDAAAATESPELGASAFLSSPPGNPDVTLAPAVVTIDVPSPTPATTSSGPATYRQFDDDLLGAERPCATDQVPFGSRVVVTNTDNGFRVACTNVLTKPLLGGEVVVLDTDTFLQLADLGDSPIPVQISW